MTEAPATDALFDRVRRGDRAAFDAWVHETAPAVWTLLRRLTSDERAAEDAMQETFLAAWRGAASFGAEGSARAWLYGIARRQAARTWRRRVGEPASAEPLTALALRAGWGDDPETLAARGEDRSALLAALGALDASSREVIVRCDLEGCAPIDLARELGIEPGTLRVRLHRARLQLLAALTPEVCDG